MPHRVSLDLPLPPYLPVSSSTGKTRGGQLPGPVCSGGGGVARKTNAAAAVGNRHAVVFCFGMGRLPGVVILGF